MADAGGTPTFGNNTQSNRKSSNTKSDPCIVSIDQCCIKPRFPYRGKSLKMEKVSVLFFITYLRIKPTYGCSLSLVQKTLSLASTYDWWDSTESERTVPLFSHSPALSPSSLTLSLSLKHTRIKCSREWGVWGRKKRVHLKHGKVLNQRRPFS